MKWTTVGEINEYKGKSLNPARFPQEMFEMYSVPSFDSLHPEIVKGENIGASKQAVEKDDVLICKINPRINRVWCVEKFTEHRLIASSEWIVVRSKSYLSKYLRYYFSSARFRNLMNLQVAGIGGSLTRAQPKQVATYPVPVITMERQQDIVDVLSEMELLLENRQQALSLLNTLVKSRFIEMFGDPVTNTMGWGEHRLDDYITFLTSGSRGWSKYFSDDGKIFITIKNVKNNRITLENVQYVTPPDNAEAQRTKVREGDLLISITADLGRTGVVSKAIEERGAYINQHLTCIRLKQEKINPGYVSYFMESEAGKRQFDAKNQAAVKAGLNFDAIKSLKLLVPPLQLQNEYMSFVELADKSKLTVQRSIDALQTLKAKLMQDYFG